MDLDHIEWARIAEPQQDGYDTAVALTLAEQELQWRPPQFAAPPHAFEGRVALRPWPPQAPVDPALIPGRFDDPNLPWAENCVKQAWPAAYRQFADLVAVLTPMALAEPDAGSRVGSYSSHTPTPPFAVYATCFDGFGTAESLVHEMAHVKLRCLGVQVESSARLIVNPPSELYRSPLRSYRRPMTAVVHAFYSWLHITELDIRWVDVDPDRALLRMARNCAWIEFMAHEIRDNIRLDDAGLRFLPPLFAWAGRLLRGGRALLQERDVTLPAAAAAE